MNPGTGARGVVRRAVRRGTGKRPRDPARTNACVLELARARAGGAAGGTGTSGANPADRARRADRRRVRVCREAAEGRTSRETPKGVCVTEKTVQRHLSGAYQKLGISCHFQLTIAMPEWRTGGR